MTSMNGVLRIAWAYFWFVPAQRWINALGAALLAISIAITLIQIRNK